MKCLLCDDEAIAVFDMPGGCYCHPYTRIQPLCSQHIIQAHPLKGMILIEDLRADTRLPVPELGLPGTIETFVKEFGEHNRQLITTALDWLENEERKWQLSKVIDKREFILCLMQ